MGPDTRQPTGGQAGSQRQPSLSSQTIALPSPATPGLPVVRVPAVLPRLVTGVLVAHRITAGLRLGRGRGGWRRLLGWRRRGSLAGPVGGAAFGGAFGLAAAGVVAWVGGGTAARAVVGGAPVLAAAAAWLGAAVEVGVALPAGVTSLAGLVAAQAATPMMINRAKMAPATRSAALNRFRTRDPLLTCTATLQCPQRLTRCLTPRMTPMRTCYGSRGEGGGEGGGGEKGGERVESRCRARSGEPARRKAGQHVVVHQPTFPAARSSVMAMTSISAEW